MKTNGMRVVWVILFAVAIIATGVWLGVSGRPLNSALLNAHKLISLAAVIYFGFSVFQVNRASGLKGAAPVVIIISGALLLAAIISGGMASIDTMPDFMALFHQISLLLAVLATGASLYLLVRSRR